MESKETLEWFDKHGIESYVQEDKRIFPNTDKASTVRDMFLQRAKELSINVISGVSVEKISKNGEKFTLYASNSQKEYDKIIIATGGSSSDTGCSGYELAENLEHSIKELKPSLSALRTKENFVCKLAGVSVKDGEITAIFDNKQVKKSKGDFVFTHKGVSGPVIFKTSAYCAYLNYF